MAYFSYVATDANGVKVKGKEYADDYLDLTSKLREKNLFCTQYTQIEEKQQDAKYKFKTADLAFMCRQLASMLTAGISLVKSLHILYSQEENKKAKAVLLEIYEDVQKGRSFSEAIQSRPGVFPNLFVSMVAAGEASGNLDSIMTRVADHYANENKTNNKIKGAMTYPMILGILLIGVFFGLFIFIMPMFRDLAGDELPPLSAAMFGISDFMIGYWWVIILVAVVLIFIIRVLVKNPKIGYKVDQMLIKFPKVGPLLSTIYVSRFARTMANLFASGLQMVDCIEKSVDTLNNSYIQTTFHEHVVEDVKHGESLSAAIAKTGIFPGIFTSIIMVGEESGALDDILSKSADYYEDEADTAISKLVGLLEPCMIIFMGIMIGMILAGVFPILYGGMGNMGA
ncbi:MAG: type II secretion system F family protein [Ruminiclostridium sp.]|nr:type II secretion system F family protein [Ruminiclostridium sp.]MBQ8841312.1 type II secretion system F family protein [Ruminiclostridium sp.]